MTNIWTQVFEDIRKPYFEMEDPYTLSEKMAKKDWDGDGKIESEKDEVWGSRAKAAAAAGKPFTKKKKVEEGVEGSAADEKADKEGMKKYHMTSKEWEKSEMDKKADAKLSKKMKKEEVEEIDEAEKWIQGAIKKPGALHRQLGVPEGEKIPAGKLAAAAEKGGKLGQRARLAQTLKGLHKEEVENLTEVDKTQQSQKKIDVMKGKNKVVIGPQIKEEVEAWVDELVEEGYDLSKFTWEEMTEIYESVELNEGSADVGPVGDAQTVAVDTQSKKLARAKIQKDMADVKYQRAVATTESVTEYLSQRPNIFENLEEGVFTSKKSK